MRMMKLALLNFKNSFKNYLSLIISLAFTILIFLNFQNIIYSDSLAVLGAHNKDYVDMFIQVVSFVLGCFMFFFIWYSTNVFLTKRKKEIGIYVFMGLSNQKIGRLYMIETTLIGLTALVLGSLLGIAVMGLFQMLMLALSDLAVEIQFRITFKPILITATVYLIMYLLFVLKGYLNIVRSSVLNMISANRQNEYVRQKSFVLFCKAVFGVAVLGAGYYLAVKSGGQEVLTNCLAAVVLVTIGVFLLFGGFIPLLFQGLGRNKAFLYRKERCLWINSMIFRMRKNYRTYAMVSVLVLCAVTALATGFAMRNRHDNIVQFDNTYTFQLLSTREDLGDEARTVLEKNGGISYSTELPILYLDTSLVTSGEFDPHYAFVPFSALRDAAAGLNILFDIQEPAENEVISISHMPLFSLITDVSGQKITIAGQEYAQIAITRDPFFGYLQKSLNLYAVNDATYEKLLPMGEVNYTYNYCLANPDFFEQAKTELDTFVSSTPDNYTGRVAINPFENDLDWIKVAYSLCIFMFMVFILASGCIMFMKLYNDAFEEKERFSVLKKMGYSEQQLGKSVAKELATAYVTAFVVMTISSYFSVSALGKMMYTSLLSINIVSVLIVFVVFLVFYILSVSAYRRNAGL